MGRENKKLHQEGLTGQFLEIEQTLAVNQEEEPTHAIENQWMPIEMEIASFDDSTA